MRCWKRSLQHSKYKVIAHGSSLPAANKYLFAELLFFMSGEGEETTSPSFTTRYAAIEASSASLEALIASVLPACGTAKEATFPTTINLLIAVGLLFLAQMASGQRCHLACRLALKTRYCKPAFVAQSVTSVSYPWEHSPSPAGDRPIVASS